MTESRGWHSLNRSPRLVPVARRVRAVWRAFVREDDAATMAEYALLIALISMVVALTLLNIGTAVRTRFSSVSSCLAASSTC
jgi:Flp pilus assembly pilin Flp